MQSPTTCPVMWFSSTVDGITWVPSFGTQRQPKEAPKLAPSSLYFPIMLPPFNSYYRPRVRQGYQGLFGQVRAPGLRQANTCDQVEPRRKGVMFRSHGPV